MSIDPYDGALQKLILAQAETKLESLAIQKRYLDALAERHLLWAARTDRVEIAGVHFTIAQLIQEVRDKYDLLLNQDGVEPF